VNRSSSLSALSVSLLAASLSSACSEPSSGAPGAASAKPAPSALTTPSAQPSAQPSASAAGPQAKAGAGAAPTMPSEIASCEAGGAHFGGYTPTVDDLFLALGVRDDDACLPHEIAAQAVGACAAKLGATSLKLSTDRFEGTPEGCEVELVGAGAEGRKWIVLRSTFRRGSSFIGTTKVVELTNGGPKLYLDATGDHESICPTEAGASDVAAGKAGPDGWGKLGLELQRFLCARAGG